MKLHNLTASDAIIGMGNASYSSEELTTACLTQIEKRDNVVQAWAYLDNKKALSQARKADERSKENDRYPGALNGVPVGIKDIIDTKDMPTEHGTTVHRGRQPEIDAVIVDRLRTAGAVIMGKTVTAELAVYTPGKTTNPHDPFRTPGGSSSGSAAAVAAGMIPLAIGTQTNGSVIRPASFCGVVGFKPTYGSIPRSGILRQAPSLDQVGVFSRTVLDSALLASVLTTGAGYHGDTLPWPRIDIPYITKPFCRPPRIGFIKTPVWSEAADHCQKTILGYVEQVATDAPEIELPNVCSDAISCTRTIMLAEMAHNYNDLYEHHKSQLSAALVEMIKEGRKITTSRYLEAKNLSQDIMTEVGRVLRNFDAVITPATPAEAPVGLESTGSPVFCSIWSLCGVPAVSLPVLNGASGMPMGLQLVSARGNDSTLLRVAHWLETQCISTTTR